MKRGIVFVVISLALVFVAAIAMNFSEVLETIKSFPSSHGDCIIAFLLGALIMRLICWLVPASKSKKSHKDEN